MKLLVFFCGLLCLQGSLGFFSVKVMKVAFEADIKTAATPVVMSATALLKALGDLLTAIDAQIVPATIPAPTSPAPKRSFLREDPAPTPPAASGVLLMRGDVVILINYAKLINFVVGDILKLSADTTITTARDFGVLMADVAAVLKYIMISKPEMSAKNIDDVFMSTSAATITLLNGAFTMLDTELPKLSTGVQKSHGANPPNDGPKTDAILDPDNVKMFKSAIATLATNLPLASNFFTDLTLTIQAENSIFSTVAKGVIMIPASAATLLAAVQTAVSSANAAFQIPVTAGIGSVASAFAMVTAKLQMMYTDTLVAPAIITVQKAAEAYVTSISTSLQSMATGFAASTNALLMTTDGTMNSYALDLSANIGMAATSVSGFNSHVMTYLKKNTVVMRKCVMMFTALAGTIFTDVNKQFSACASGASSFQDEQKYAETNIKIILNRSTAFAASLGACLTPVTTLASAKQINRCINLVLADMQTDGAAAPDGSAAKYAAGSVGVFKADLVDSEAVFKDCVGVAYTILDKSVTAWKTALTGCT